MPDQNGRLVPIAVPRVWCAVCKLFACTCPPAPVEHNACGTPRCCRAC